MKKTKFIISLLLCVILLILATACSEEQNESPVLEPVAIDFISADETDGVFVISTMWANNSEDSFSFGKNGTLYVKNNDKFEKIGSVMGDNKQTLLRPGEVAGVKYTPVDCKIETGKTYMLEANVNYSNNGENSIETASMEFEVK